MRTKYCMVFVPVTLCAVLDHQPSYHLGPMLLYMGGNVWIHWKSSFAGES